MKLSLELTSPAKFCFCVASVLSGTHKGLISLKLPSIIFILIVFNKFQTWENYRFQRLRIMGR